MQQFELGAVGYLTTVTTTFCINEDAKAQKLQKVAELRGK